MLTNNLYYQFRAKLIILTIFLQLIDSQYIKFTFISRFLANCVEKCGIAPQKSTLTSIHNANVRNILLHTTTFF